MGIDIHMTNNIPTALSNIQHAKDKALESCGLQGESYAKALCPVDTGALRNSISHNVSGDDCIIGTNQEYAAYVELGTGIYATTGGGRTTPWVYQDGKGNWHLTNGQRAQPYLKPAVADHSSTYRQIIEQAFKSG